MRRLYLTLAILFVTSIMLFIGAFIYLDKEKHKRYYYTLELDGHDAGSIEAEKFITEDQVIYKSISDLPFYPSFTNSEARMVFDRRYSLLTFSREDSVDGTWKTIHMENRGNKVSFIATSAAEFTYVNDIPVRNETFVFEEGSILSYLPILDNYDFARGRTQAFNALIIFHDYLPPMKRVVTITSVKDDYMEIDAHTVRTEQLVLKLRNYPQATIYVSKQDRSIVLIEIPQMRLKIKRIVRPRKFDPKPYILKDETYVAKDVEFKSKNARLSGTFTVPKKEGKHPGAVLVWGPGPQDRDYLGLFASIADYLSKNDYCVLRFDKRGVGSSTGDRDCTISEEVEDIKAAIEFLANREEADPQKIFLIAHSTGMLSASKAALEKETVKALVLLTPVTSSRIKSDVGIENLKAIAARYNWSEDYVKLAMRSSLETRQKVESAKGSWMWVLGKRFFVKRMKEEIAEDAVETIRRLKMPVLILQGKNDEALFVESAPILDKALEDAGHKSHSLIYFGYLGHYLGPLVSDGASKIHYEADIGVLERIKKWLGEALVDRMQLPEETVKAK